MEFPSGKDCLAAAVGLVGVRRYPCHLAPVVLVRHVLINSSLHVEGLASCQVAFLPKIFGSLLPIVGKNIAIVVSFYLFYVIQTASCRGENEITADIRQLAYLKLMEHCLAPYFEVCKRELVFSVRPLFQSVTALLVCVIVSRCNLSQCRVSRTCDAVFPQCEAFQHRLSQLADGILAAKLDAAEECYQSFGRIIRYLRQSPFRKIGRSNDLVSNSISSIIISNTSYRPVFFFKQDFASRQNLHCVGIKSIKLSAGFHHNFFKEGYYSVC